MSQSVRSRGSPDPTTRQDQVKGTANGIGTVYTEKANRLGEIAPSRRTLTEAEYQFIVSRPWVDEAIFAKIQRRIRSGQWTVLRDPLTQPATQGVRA